ncbi:MAG: anion permease [Clostridia bacterium]|nr:anion permease [Clostridia bacterium]
MKIFVLICFIITYILIIAFPKKKALISGVFALVLATSLLIFGKVGIIGLITSIDYNVVLMLVGIMITVGFFAGSNMPVLLADKLIEKMPNTILAVTTLCVLSGFISAFIDNVATVLMLAPIGIAVAKKVNVSAIPVIIGISVSSNLQGAATLVGDTTSIMLGSFANMSFFDFFFLNGKPSIFFAVELGALATIPVIIFLFRKNNNKLLFNAEKTEIVSVVPTVIILLNILTLIVFSFIKDKWELTNGIICIFYAFVSLLFWFVFIKKGTGKVIKGAVDYQTVLFLTFLFIIIFAVKTVGIIDDISEIFAKIGVDNVFLLYTVIVFGSVIMSAFIDNIPFVATMLPVISSLCLKVPTISPYLLYFGLLIGATLGGNITPIGASANVVGIGILNKEGYKVKNKDFYKIGIPFTLIAVIVGYLFIWFIWC